MRPLALASGLAGAAATLALPWLALWLSFRPYPWTGPATVGGCALLALGALAVVGASWVVALGRSRWLALALPATGLALATSPALALLAAWVASDTDISWQTLDRADRTYAVRIRRQWNWRNAYDDCDAVAYAVEGWHLRYIGSMSWSEDPHEVGCCRTGFAERSEGAVFEVGDPERARVLLLAPR